MDVEQLRHDGYTVVEQVVPPENVAAVLDIVRELEDFDVADPATWYGRDATVPVWGHQALWDNRQHPAVHAAFAQAYGTERLWVSMDRVAIKPPVRPDEPKRGDARPMHWDLDPRDPPGQLFEGVLYLTDTAIEQSGFCCVPEVFRDRAGWLQRHPGADTHDIDTEGASIVVVAGRAGDLVIYDAMLPHGSGRNTAGSPLLAQYIAMHTPGFWGDTAQERIALWREGQVNPEWRDPPGHDRVEPWPPAQLTPLGRRLLGLDPWP